MRTPLCESPEESKLFQFTLRRFLLAAVGLSAYLALAVESWRQFARFTTQLESPDGQVYEVADLLLAELAVLSEVTVACAFWTLCKLYRIRCLPFVAGSLIGLPVISVLLNGPGTWLRMHGWIGDHSSQAVALPMAWLFNYSLTLRPALTWYMDLWL